MAGGCIECYIAPSAPSRSFNLLASGLIFKKKFVRFKFLAGERAFCEAANRNSEVLPAGDSLKW
jgi:hypothetical protein